MKNETYYIKNENLKKQANIIFNGLVKNAYIEMFYISPAGNTNASYKERVDYFNKKDCSISREISYDANSFVLEFNNGSLVEFTNSEGASISNIGMENLITD